MGFAKQIGDIGALISRILAAVFFTILILTGNTMAQSIRERVPELAILKTLGFSDGRVTALVLAEAALLLLIGGGVGMAAAVGMLPFLNQSTGGRFPPLFVAAGTWVAAVAVAAALAARRGRAARLARPPAPHRGRARGTPVMRTLHQIAMITLVNLRNLPQRLGTSLVVVIGHRGGGGRAGGGALDVGRVPAHPREHRARRPRHHAAGRLRRGDVERRLAGPGAAGREPARRRPRRGVAARSRPRSWW